MPDCWQAFGRSSQQWYDRRTPLSHELRRLITRGSRVDAHGNEYVERCLRPLMPDGLEHVRTDAHRRHVEGPLECSQHARRGRFQCAEHDRCGADLLWSPARQKAQQGSESLRVLPFFFHLAPRILSAVTHGHLQHPTRLGEAIASEGPLESWKPRP